MKITIKQLKQIIKEQVEEGWSDKDDSGPRGPSLRVPTSQGAPKLGWEDKDSSLDDADDFDAEGAELITNATVALEEAQDALAKIANHYDYQGKSIASFNREVANMIGLLKVIM